MKIKTLLIAVALVASSLTYAQKGDDRKEDREAKKIAYISTSLDLTPEEAKDFWPVYNEMEEERKEIRKQYKDVRPRDKKLEEMSDEEVEKLLSSMMEMKQKELDLKKKYHEKFKAVLPVKKVAKLYHAEMKAHHRMKGKRGDHRSKSHKGDHRHKD